MQDFKAFSHGEQRRDFLRVFFLSTGLWAVILIRLQAKFYEKRFLFISYLIHRMNLILHGIDVLPGATIGSGLRIEHPVGIVIGAGVKIGDQCTILQGVTLGTNNVVDNHVNDSYPVIGNNVVIGCNTSVLGKVIVGDNVMIGSHSLVLKSIDSNSRVLGGVHK